MPFTKGHTKIGGRKKGSQNKYTSDAVAQAHIAVAVSNGEEPLDFMLRIMRDESHPLEFRAAMARAAAPYRHPTLQSTQVRHANIDGTPIGPTIVNQYIEMPRQREQPVVLLEPPSDSRH